MVAGKKVWHKYNCNDCHTVLGFGGYYAPDMTKAYFRLGENNIVSIVMNPEKVYKKSFRKMPHLGVTKEEAGQLVEFLKWVGTIENRHWPPQDEKFVKAYRLRETSAQTLNKADIVMGACGGCHSLENLGRSMAGDFNDIAKTTAFDRATLVKYTSTRSPSGPIPACPPERLPGDSGADRRCHLPGRRAYDGAPPLRPEEGAGVTGSTIFARGSVE